LENDVTFRVVYFEEIDQEQFCALHKKAFAALMEKENFDNNYLTKTFFSWKYNPPSGRARIAVAERQGNIIATNSMLPLEVIRNETICRAWQSCDTVVDSQERGKGYFLKCLALLRREIPAGDFFMGFPNGNSVNGFIKSGWHKALSVPIYVNPFAFIPVLDKKRNDALTFDKLNGVFESPRQGMWKIHFTPAYLNWRYRQHPYNEYKMELARDKVGEGVIVYRIAKVRGATFILIMEYVGTFSCFKKCLKVVHDFAHSNQIAIIGYFTNQFSYWQFLQLGFIHVPGMFVSRKLDLCLERVGGQQQGDDDWCVQTGDYDLF
jgi:hypothetical protein